MSGAHFHSLRVARIRPDADDACVLTFEVPSALRDRFAFQPGQYLTLRAQVDGQDLRRSYSICAARGEQPRVGVRRVPGGAFSSWLHQTLKVGDAIEVMEPEGRFGLALSKAPRHVLAVAGGSGVTPLLSILKSVLATDERTRCTLLYGNRDSASTMFKEELEDLKNRYITRLAIHTVFSREQVDSPLQSGRLDREKVATLLRLAGPVDQAFVCGPHAMNDEMESALLAAGLPADRIHVERFGLPPDVAAGLGTPVSHEPQAGDAATAVITIVRDGLTRDVRLGSGDDSILAAAARAGLDVPYSCKSGVCATCRAKLVAGQVRMDRNFALEKADLEAGFVLTCQAHPLTAQVTVSFDER
jgi:ring-1,2-phenylacetyl-CoA epoxidase subunit PaaE